MKKMFTKLFSAVLLTGLTVIGFTAKAQSTSLADGAQTVTTASASTADTKTDKTIDQKTKAKAKAEAQADDKMAAKVAADPDTAWKPQRRLWGYAFGDEYFDSHSPGVSVPQGKENNYYQVPSYRNAFQFRRLYLGYDYEISKKFKAEVLLASEPTANTGVNGSTSIQGSDNLVDGKMGFFIKNFNIRTRDLWKGTDFVIGELSTPGFALNEPGTNAPTSLSETTWSYRSVERTITDFHKNNSFDVGASLQGTFDPTTKNYGYVLMVSNNSAASLLNASNPNSGFYKIFYGDIWGKFANNHIYADFYYHTARSNAATAAIGGQGNSMYKIFAAYVSRPFNMGVEAYTQTFVNGVIDNGPVGATGAPKVVQNATVNGLSIWVRGAIYPTLNYFAKFDNYNPNTDFVGTDSYSVNAGPATYGAYDPYTKEHFTTFGLDFNPIPNVHFMPNIWYIQYIDNNTPTVTGYVPNNHTLVYRFTFFFTFGK